MNDPYGTSVSLKDNRLFLVTKTSNRCHAFQWVQDKENPENSTYDRARGGSYAW